VESLTLRICDSKGARGSPCLGELIIVEVQGRREESMLRSGSCSPGDMQVVLVSMHPREASKEVEAVRRKRLALLEGCPVGGKGRNGSQ
jgi:hypothetical protein